jgi:hypothetical protein
VGTERPEDRHLRRRGAVLTTADALAWLEELRARVPTLRSESAPRLYWSQKQGRQAANSATDLQATVTRCRAAISDLERQNWFARTLGFECVDDYSDPGVTLEDVLERRVGKPQLAELPAEQWTEDDLCDFVEVLHDVAARPTREHFHSWNECGWHPADYNRASGQALYRWRMNQVLEASTLRLRLAAEGEDIGRMVRILPGGLDDLVVELADVAVTGDPSVPHAIGLFRQHGATREDRRSAVRELADVLEADRALIKDKLLSKDEDALFLIANKFAIRHRGANQQNDYPDDYLDWLFHWYLATVELVRRISQR